MTDRIETDIGEDSGRRAVELFFADFASLQVELSGSPSGLAALERCYPRHLIIAAASSLEARMKALVPSLFRQHGREEIGTFIEKQVMARGYHALFEWDSGNANKFFVLFGNECKIGFRSAARENQQLEKQESAFIKIGSMRNNLVHRDYSTLPVPVTSDEVQTLFELANRFVDCLPDYLFPTEGGERGAV